MSNQVKYLAILALYCFMMIAIIEADIFNKITEDVKSIMMIKSGILIVLTIAVVVVINTKFRGDD